MCFSSVVCSLLKQTTKKKKKKESDARFTRLTHILNTKDFKLWKSPTETETERATRTHHTWFYLLFLLLNMVRASGLEQTFKATWSHTESILNLVCLYYFVLVFVSFLSGGMVQFTVLPCSSFVCYIWMLHFVLGFFWAVTLNILCTCEFSFLFFLCVCAPSILLTRTQLNFRP